MSCGDPSSKRYSVPLACSKGHKTRQTRLQKQTYSTMKIPLYSKAVSAGQNPKFCSSNIRILSNKTNPYTINQSWLLTLVRESRPGRTLWGDGWTSPVLVCPKSVGQEPSTAVSKTLTSWSAIQKTAYNTLTSINHQINAGLERKVNMNILGSCTCYTSINDIKLTSV